MSLPSLEQRLALRQQPNNKKPVMFQKWRKLLFLHWEIEPELIQKTLPKGLYVDTFQRKAYLGLIPFFMKDIRLRYLPALYPFSSLLEINVRTYVYDEKGRPGVWFYSLDANSSLAVWIAKTCFNLPYSKSNMSASKEYPIHYQTVRKNLNGNFKTDIRYSAGEDISEPLVESLEFFLVERYLLFTQNTKTGQLFSGQVFHSPYQLKSAEYKIEEENLTALAGFDRQKDKPDHVVFSEGVDVSIFSLDPVF